MIGTRLLWFKFSISCGRDRKEMKSLPIPWEWITGSESAEKRKSKEPGCSVRVCCRIEYIERNENAAVLGSAWIRWIRLVPSRFLTF